MEYSYDLRKKAMKLYEKKYPVSKISRLFTIARATLYNWINLEKATGDVRAKTKTHNGYGHKITDREAFKTFVDQNSGLTHKELAELWPAPIASRTIGKYLKRIGYTRKKRQSATLSGMKSCENNSVRK